MRLKKFDLKKYLAENKLLKEGNITITHNDVTGDSKSTVIDVSLIDNLINRLQPIVGNKTIEINNKMREDFIQTIVRRLTGYTDMGGGNVRINENKPLDENYKGTQKQQAIALLIMDAIDKDFSDGGAIDSSTMIPAIIEIFQNYNVE